MSPLIFEPGDQVKVKPPGKARRERGTVETVYNDKRDKPIEVECKDGVFSFAASEVKKV